MLSSKTIDFLTKRLEEAELGLQNCGYDKECVLFCIMPQKVELRVGLYYPYIRNWLEVLPRSQMYFIKFEEYAADRVSILRGVFDFLGVCEFLYHF